MSDEFDNYNKENDNNNDYNGNYENTNLNKDKETSYNDSIYKNTISNENIVTNDSENNYIENQLNGDQSNGGQLNESHFNERQNEDVTEQGQHPTNTENRNAEEEETSTTYRFWADQINTPKEYVNNQTNYNQNQYDQNHYGQNQYDQNQNNNSETLTNAYDQDHYNQNNQYFKNSIEEGINSNSYYSNEAKDTNGEDNQKRNKKKNPVKKVLKFIAFAAVFGVIAGVTFIGFNLAYYKLNPDAAGNSFSISSNKLNLNPITGSDYKIPSTTVTSNAVQQKTDITDIVDSTMPSIVTIDGTFTQTTTDFFGQQVNQEVPGSGSGIIIDKTEKELLIATNNHVVEGAQSITVSFIDDSKAEATIKGKDSTADLAVISINLSDLDDKTLDAIKVAKLGDSDSIKVGQMAVAIGNALGYGQSVTVGYISAKDREVSIDGNKMVLLQTDAAINPGNSGGALLNIKGEVIGINSVKYASSEVEGMGYAIPISNALPIISQLKNKETIADEDKGYLGVYIKQITQEISDLYNWPVGIYVIEAIDGGSAKAAGITAGDIITKVNGTKVTSETQLQETVSSNRAGTKVKLTIMRMTNGKFVEQEIEVTLGSSSNTK